MSSMGVLQKRFCESMLDEARSLGYNKGCMFCVGMKHLTSPPPLENGHAKSGQMVGVLRWGNG